MTQVLKKSAQSVQEVLTKHGVNSVVKELSSSTRTANDAATSIGCDVAQIVKSLIFKTKNSSSPVLVLVSGINRVSEEAITKAVGEEITKADADYTRDVTGFAIGGVPPVGHKQPIIHTYIDEDLLLNNIVWAAAGTPNAVFSISSKDLSEITKGKVMPIK